MEYNGLLPLSEREKLLICLSLTRNIFNKVITFLYVKETEINSFLLIFILDYLKSKRL